ncbi:ComF family protein [Aliterella atlantica]|uniref:Alpha-L-fucosidase n=1 Tax=Aliterella atlantica CENA595 TaxID=1618023 RepID=A0A0D8ZQR3_9CYAN|nr:ComF family protein [Aliterella atlantica]KJH71153.1 hypothetical protein UH38_14170 [Aliterella atlantica CENA595]
MAIWTRNLLNIFLKSNCPLCDRPTNAELCLDCTRQIQKCRLPSDRSFLKQEIPIFVWGNYHGTLKRAIAALKYDNQPQLARPLGTRLAQTWLQSQFARSGLIVVPIPLHINKQKQRGYNQALLLAQSFCEVTGLKWQHGLERQQDTEAQFKLSPLQREQNLAMAFKLSPKFCQHQPTNRVLLLDDIYTTGATARQAAQTLQQQGIAVYGMVAIATSQRQ